MDLKGKRLCINNGTAPSRPTKAAKLQRQIQSRSARLPRKVRGLRLSPVAASIPEAVSGSFVQAADDKTATIQIALVTRESLIMVQGPQVINPFGRITAEVQALLAAHVRVTY